MELVLFFVSVVVLGIVLGLCGINVVDKPWLFFAIDIPAVILLRLFWIGVFSLFN